MKRCLLAIVAVFMSALSHAQTLPDSTDYEVVPKTCTPQKPRFPAIYAKYKALKGFPAANHFKQLELYTKYDNSDIQVEAALQEIDLTGNGICDLRMVCINAF